MNHPVYYKEVSTLHQHKYLLRYMTGLYGYTFRLLGGHSQDIKIKWKLHLMSVNPLTQ
jgi:hypothetical protein